MNIKKLLREVRASMCSARLSIVAVITLSLLLLTFTVGAVCEMDLAWSLGAIVAAVGAAAAWIVKRRDIDLNPMLQKAAGTQEVQLIGGLGGSKQADLAVQALESLEATCRRSTARRAKFSLVFAGAALGLLVSNFEGALAPRDPVILMPDFAVASYSVPLDPALSRSEVLEEDKRETFERVIRDVGRTKECLDKLAEAREILEDSEASPKQLERAQELMRAAGELAKEVDSKTVQKAVQDAATKVGALNKENFRKDRSSALESLSQAQKELSSFLQKLLGLLNELAKICDALMEFAQFLADLFGGGDSSSGDSQGSGSPGAVCAVRARRGRCWGMCVTSWAAASRRSNLRVAATRPKAAAHPIAGAPRTVRFSMASATASTSSYSCQTVSVGRARWSSSRSFRSAVSWTGRRGGRSSVLMYSPPPTGDRGFG